MGHRTVTRWIDITELPPLPARPVDGHKGTFGSVLIIAGSRGMSGAAVLCGRAALHGGAGLVTVATPASVGMEVAIGHPSYMTVLLPEDDWGRIVPEASAVLRERLVRKSAAAIGPGLGQSADVQRVVVDLYCRTELPLVLDADALNALAADISQMALRTVDSPRVLTPHPGEFSRLTGQDTKSIQANRCDIAFDFARHHQVVLVLKGHRTIVTDGERLFENRTGDTSLASGGSGDVLTGLLTSLLAQGMSAFEAAQLAVHLHGLAGEFTTARYSDRFATSVELIEQLASAWRHLEQQESAR